MGSIDEQCDKAMSPTTDKKPRRWQHQRWRESQDHQWSEVVEIDQEPQPSAEGHSSPDVRQSAC